MSQVMQQLKWMSSFAEYSESQQKMLISLSHADHVWRTKSGICEGTGIAAGEVDQLLSDLMGKGLVRTGLSTNKEIIFALDERLDDSTQADQAQPEMM